MGVQADRAARESAWIVRIPLENAVRYCTYGQALREIRMHIRVGSP